MAMNTGSKPELTAPGVEVWIQEEADNVMIDSLLSKVFTVETTSRLYEDDSSWAGIDYPELVGEAASSPEDDLLIGYTWRYELNTYKRKMAITSLLNKTDLYSIAKAEEMSRELAKKAAQGREINAFSVLRNAFDSDYVYGDGMPLISVQHPRKDGGSAQRNTFLDGVQDSLSYDALKDLEDVMYEVFSNKGIPLSIGLDSKLMLIVTPYNREQALQIAEADMIPGSVDESVNYFKGRNLDVLVCPYISWRFAYTTGETSSTDRATYDERFFLIDPSFAKKMLKFKQLQNFEVKAWEDEDTDVMYAKVADVYAYGISGWFGIVGSLGDGTTYTS
jgi:hypothetical protein